MADTEIDVKRVRRQRDKLRAVSFAQQCAQQARLIRDAETPADRAENEPWFENSDKTSRVNPVYS